MPWLVGIDEAGYGPNLGPFVMSMAALHVPAESADADLWQLLAKAVRRANSPDDGRLVVDDSKAVYSPNGGLPRLEQHLLPFRWQPHWRRVPLQTYWQSGSLTPWDDLQAEPWFAEGTVLPLLADAADVLAGHERWLELCASLQVALGRIVSVVVFPRRFNDLIEQHHSKAAVPAWALGRLLACLPEPLDDAPTRVWVDKLGGRNHYHPLLQDIFPDTFIMCRCESARRSAYQVIRSQGDYEIALEPESDSRYFPVALASMASKYLREVLMEQFNCFWQAQVPGLTRTAGYPGDAARFYEDIRPARARLGIADDMLWRAR